MKHAIQSMFITILCAAVSVMVMSCHHTSEPDLPPVDPDPAPRTVLVYMVATNNLGSNGFDDSDLKEMCTALASGDNQGGRLVVYHASDYGIILKEVTPTGFDTLKVYDKSKLSVSIERMREVIKDTKALAKADDYGLVLWSHATGWIQDGFEQPSKGQRSYALDGTKTMNITALREAIEDAGFSFIYFDCCYMGSVEVAYELRRCAPYFIASATEDPADGMPYHLTLRHLFDKGIDAESALINAASTTFNHYNDVFKRGDCPCTMAVVRTDKIDALACTARKIYLQAKRSYNSDYTYQKFKVTGTCSYYDLDQYVESLCTDEALLNEWSTALNETVIYAGATPYIWSSTPILRHCGLSTYILANEMTSTNNGYNTLSWYPDVASALFVKTQQE